MSIDEEKLPCGGDRWKCKLQDGMTKLENYFTEKVDLDGIITGCPYFKLMRNHITEVAFCSHYLSDIGRKSLGELRF